MEHLLLIPLQSVCVVCLTLDPGLAEQCNRAEITGDALLTCSLSMAVFKAS